jgi:ubiquinone/menaquinone biosynthesis C-methylase UbiE
MSSHSEISVQRNYYAQTAHLYDDMHVQEGDEHYFALCWMSSLIEMLGISSILDVGSGTGRAIAFLRKWHPNLRIIGLEPVTELRNQGHKNGIPQECLIGGDAMSLNFADDEFDMVCEFGALHHMHNPSKAVSEMLRVGKKAIFISDSNNFGQGSFFSRSIKHLINKMGLWGVYDYLATKGKGYHYSDGDGIFYSYSVFNNYKLIKQKCKSVHLMNTQDAGHNLYKTSSHIALLGLKK